MRKSIWTSAAIASVLMFVASSCGSTEDSTNFSESQGGASGAGGKGASGSGGSGKGGTSAGTGNGGSAGSSSAGTSGTGNGGTGGTSAGNGGTGGSGDGGTSAGNGGTGDGGMAGGGGDTGEAGAGGDGTGGSTGGTSGGSAGTGGASGSAGTGGASGSAGTGGASGSAGTGGSTGGTSGGSAGTGGSTGGTSGGSAGTGGEGGEAGEGCGDIPDPLDHDCDDDDPKSLDFWSTRFGTCGHWFEAGVGTGWVVYEASPNVSVDVETGIAWTTIPGSRNQSNGAVACSNLSRLGLSDWRLPTIDEARTLAAGCAPQEPGGSCPVSEACLAMSCDDGPACTSCPGGSSSSSPRDDDQYCRPEVTLCTVYHTSSNCSDCPTPSNWAYAPTNGHFLALESFNSILTVCAMPDVAPPCFELP